MAETDVSQDQNPFSREKALRTWEENMDRARTLRNEIRRGQETGASVRDQLLRAAEAVGCLTDNTVFPRIVRRALEARDRS